MKKPKIYHVQIPEKVAHNFLDMSFTKDGMLTIRWMDPDEIDHGKSKGMYQLCPKCNTLHLVVFEDGYEKCHYCSYQSSTGRTNNAVE